MERAPLGCSRVRREIPSGLNQQWPETGRIALSSEHSYRYSSFACLESWHRALLVAEEELGAHEGRGC